MTNSPYPSGGTLPPGAWPVPLAPGERPVLFTHAQLIAVRRDSGLGDYDLLMRRPTEGPQAEELQGTPLWQPVPAAKYLKFRALEWREADEIGQLPGEFRAAAETVDEAFGPDGADGAGDDEGEGS